jgi:DNA-binding transcriptional ArsR family regulator
MKDDRSKKTTPACRHDSHEVRRPVPTAQSLERTAQLLRAMGDAHRLRLLELLKQGELCVSEIVDTMQDKFSTISQRLRLLRSEGLVVRRREGTHLFYALSDRHVVDLIRNARDHAEELEAAPATSPDEGD